MEEIKNNNNTSPDVKTDEFEGIAPQKMLDLMHSIPIENCPYEKILFKSYKAWDKLTSTQQSITCAWWRQLSAEVKQGLFEKARSAIIADVAHEKNRSANTNKHDLCRLLHLFVEPSAQTAWSRAHRPLTRIELDTRKTEEGEKINAFNKLAEIFNDYKNFKYTNVTILYNSLGNPISPYVSNARMELLSTRTWDLNPCAPDRPIRDGGWIREKMKELRKDMTKVYQKYSKSGNQDAENVYDEWYNFSSILGNDVITYSKAVISDMKMNQLGKALPDDMQKDTGILQDEATFQKSIGEKNKKRVEELRENEKEKKRFKTKSTEIEQNMVTSLQNMEKSFTNGINQQNKNAALALFLKHGTVEEKAKAKALLAKEAGL
jgi:hypothetical protein